MATRPVRYELHVRPLMRMIDRDNMAWAFDLWDYDQVRTHADAILQRIQADMPPASYGGPWPQEWIALFQRWKAEGFPRLDLGSVDTAGYKATREGTTVTLTGRGKTPTGGYRAWLDAIVPEGSPREYVLYWEPPVPLPAPAPTLFRAKAVYHASAGATDVVVIDANGRHTVPIVTAPVPLRIRGTVSRLQPALERVGAALVQSVPMAGGSCLQYRAGAGEFEVFSDEQTVEVEGPADLLAQIQKAIDAASRQ